MEELRCRTEGDQTAPRLNHRTAGVYMSKVTITALPPNSYIPSLGVLKHFGHVVSSLSSVSCLLLSLRHRFMDTCITC